MGSCDGAAPRMVICKHCGTSVPKTELCGSCQQPLYRRRLLPASELHPKVPFRRWILPLWGVAVLSGFFFATSLSFLDWHRDSKADIIEIRFGSKSVSFSYQWLEELLIPQKK